MQEHIKHIAIAGNIGVGKTTLTTALCEHFKWTPNYETVDDNPYLDDFYEDMNRWSFNLQVYFLNKRFNQLMQIQNGNKPVIQDRTIYEDALIFVPNLYALRLISKRDYDNYFQLYQTLSAFIKPPDLLIYLKSSVPTLVHQIAKRGRKFEENIRKDYLESLNQLYNQWIDGYTLSKLLVIDVDNTNFDENKADLDSVIQSIKKML